MNSNKKCHIQVRTLSLCGMSCSKNKTTTPYIALVRVLSHHISGEKVRRFFRINLIRKKTSTGSNDIIIFERKFSFQIGY